MRRLPIITAALLFPTAAYAHPDLSHLGGMLAGFGHPLGGMDHVLAMLAVGVLAAALGNRALFVVPMSFVGVMIAGFLLGVAGIDLPLVELSIALSSVVIGSAAALGRPMSTAGAAALVGIFGLFHGYAHGAEMPADADGALYAGGFVAATALLHLVGIGAAVGSSKLAGRYRGLAARIAGGGFALGGVGLLIGWI